jgi:hypothetical protein
VQMIRTAPTPVLKPKRDALPPIHPPRSATPNRRGTAADAGTTNAIAVAQLSLNPPFADLAG